MNTDVDTLRNEVKSFLKEREMPNSVFAQRAHLSESSLRNFLLCKCTPQRGTIVVLAKTLEDMKKTEQVSWKDLREDMLEYKRTYKLSLQEFSELLNVSYSVLQQALCSEESIGYYKTLRLCNAFNRVNEGSLIKFDEQEIRTRINELIESGEETAYSIAIKAGVNRHTVVSFMNNQRNILGSKLLLIMKAVNELSKKRRLHSYGSR